MKEIDFLPEWYKSGRRRQVSYRTQYVALGGVLVVMVVWSMVSANSISRATAGLAKDAVRQAEAAGAAQEFVRIKSEVTQLQKKAESIKEIDSKIDVAGVLAEMSFLIDEKMVLRKVGFFGERFTDEQEGKPKRDSAVRAAGGNFSGKETRPLGDIRFRVVVSGVASDASSAAGLICKLEDSPYFCQVVPSFSRNKKMKVGTGLAGENFQVSEFEISCYLANYKELVVDN